MKSLSSGQHFPKCIGPSRIANSYADSQKGAKIEFVRGFVPVLVICKFNEDSIKTEVSIVQTTVPKCMSMED